MREIQNPDKKLAILLFGIHYLNKYQHWMKWETNIDYRKSVDNYKKNIYHAFGDYYIDTFISSYVSDKQSELIETYNPKCLSFVEIDNNGKTNVEQRYDRFINGLKMIKEYQDAHNIEYDLYVMTRFDLLFLKTISSLDIQQDKINISYNTICGDDSSFVDDNLYILTKGNLEKFYKICEKIPKNIWFHNLNRYNGEYDINQLVKGAYYSHKSPLYKILR